MGSLASMSMIGRSRSSLLFVLSSHRASTKGCSWSIAIEAVHYTKMADIDSPGVLVARFLRSNNYSEVLRDPSHHTSRNG